MHCAYNVRPVINSVFTSTILFLSSSTAGAKKERVFYVGVSASVRETEEKAPDEQMLNIPTTVCAHDTLEMNEIATSRAKRQIPKKSTELKEYEWKRDEKHQATDEDETKKRAQINK